MRRSLPKKKVIKAPDVDDACIDRFSLVEIEDYRERVEEEGEAEPEEQQEEVQLPEEPSRGDEGDEEKLKEELESARREGFEKGYREGLERGKKEGYEEGYGSGYEEGFARGKEEGYREGREEGKREGYKEGFSLGKKEGFEEGKREGRDLVEKRYGDILSRAQEQVSALVALRERFEEKLRAAEDELVSSVLLMVRKLVFITPPEEMVRNMVRECLDRLVEEQSAKLRLNPKDYTLVSDKLEFPSHVEVVQDASVPRGSCVVEMETGSVETSLSERIRDLEEIVLKKLNGE